MTENNTKEFFRTSSTYPLKWEPESGSYFLGRKAAAIGRQLHQDILAEINPTDSIILDAGVGRGRLVNDLLLRKPELLVCADLSIYMIKMTKDSVKNKNQENLEFVLCDMERLPFKSDTFDLILCIGVIMHLVHAQEALTEFSRLLKTQGLLITDNINNSIIGHLYVVGFNLMQVGFLSVLKKYLKTRKVGSDISASYSLKEQQDFHQRANLAICKVKAYGSKYFPWIFLTLSRRRS